MTQRAGIRTRIAIVFVAMVPFAISACGGSYSASGGIIAWDAAGLPTT